MNTKICSKCKEEKPISEFYRNKSKKDGYRYECKECTNKQVKSYKQKNKECIKETQKQWYQNNKKRLKTHYKDNKELISQKRKTYYKNNKEEILQYKKQYYQNNALYETYIDRLTMDEEPKLSKDNKSLEVKCKYCGKYFIPINGDVKNRIQSLNGTQNGVSYLYCSDECKQSCSIYRKIFYPEGFKPATSREVQPQLRKLVLERDNWTCQKCSNTDTLHCHHIDPVKNNPIESADMDNCITLCVNCHKDVHQINGCKTGELANC